jgi:deoxycytidylate deaminase
MSFNPNTPRLSKPEYGCYLALAARSRSEDPHTQVGVTLFDQEWRTVATGFNGFGPGFLPKENVFKDRETKACLINHAEINAILYASRQPYYACMVYSPCIHCAKTIAASKIKSVYFIQQYIKGSDQQPDLKYQDIFKFYGINCIQIDNKNIKKILYWSQKDQDFLNSIYVKP